jgi:hypothetical protein
VLAYIEHYRGVVKGDKVLQLAFGSGFKCNSAVWVANKSFKEQCYAWEVSRACLLFFFFFEAVMLHREGSGIPPRHWVLLWPADALHECSKWRRVIGGPAAAARGKLESSCMGGQKIFKEQCYA